MVETREKKACQSAKAILLSSYYFSISLSFLSILDSTRNFLYFVTVFSDLLFLRSFNAAKNRAELDLLLFCHNELTVFLSCFAISCVDLLLSSLLWTYYQIVLFYGKKTIHKTAVWTYGI